MYENTVVLFQGDERFAYRDPACAFCKGKYYLFFTLSEKTEQGFMYNRVAVSESVDLLNWSEPRAITPRDKRLNFSSPGNIFKYGKEYYVCVCSYPMIKPFAEQTCANEDARLYFIRTRDFKEYSEPEIINPKGATAVSDIGRMIDPFVFEDETERGLFHLFFKQNGISHATSRDLFNWEFKGRADGGENACVVREGEYLYLIHSPADGIGIKRSRDLSVWEDLGVSFLDRENFGFADGRLTAGFVLPAPEGTDFRYALFFHGSRKDSFPETHGAASIALCLINSSLKDLVKSV